jgi:hypothetical protein
MAVSDQLIPASATLHQDSKGMTGQLSYLVDEADLFNPLLPTPGSVWPGPQDLPYLRCIEANWTQRECDIWAAVYEFSTERQLGEDFCDVSVSGAVENVDTTQGWTWKDTGTTVEIDIPTPIGVEVYEITVRKEVLDYSALRTAINCVNDRVFHSYAAGTLLLETYRVTQSYTLAGETSSAQVSYSFKYNAQGHNKVWRPPLQDVDADGNGLVYQNKDSEKTDSYTTDVTLVGAKVYVDSAAPVGGAPAGVGAWDTPQLSGANRYAECDFATVLGLPKNPGDG